MPGRLLDWGVFACAQRQKLRAEVIFHTLEELRD